MKYKLQNYGIPIDPRDEKYILKKVESGFSPERNKQIIEDSIRKTDLFRQKQWKVWDEKTRERANALASFFKYLEKGQGGNNPLSKYFSRKMRAYLRGEQVVAELKSQGKYVAVNVNGQFTRYAETQ